MGFAVAGRISRGWVVGTLVLVGCGAGVREEPVQEQASASLALANPTQVRALLEQRYQGMSGDGAVLKMAPTIAAIEAVAKHEMREWQVPINYWETPEWTEFTSGVRPGDTLVYFRNNRTRWQKQGGAVGYAIVRNGELVRSFLIAQS